jgi:hypothetical protein
MVKCVHVCPTGEEHIVSVGVVLSPYNMKGVGTAKVVRLQQMEDLAEEKKRKRQSWQATLEGVELTYDVQSCQYSATDGYELRYWDTDEYVSSFLFSFASVLPPHNQLIFFPASDSFRSVSHVLQVRARAP